MAKPVAMLHAVPRSQETGQSQARPCRGIKIEYSVRDDFAQELSMATVKKPNDINSYIAEFPADVQAILEKVRLTIRKAAPVAKETISYQMPAFRQHGMLVYFAAWKNHIGLYPPFSGDKALEKALVRYAGPKGNLQFPLDEPIPYNLIERIVKARV